MHEWSAHYASAPFGEVSQHIHHAVGLTSPGEVYLATSVP